jgi:hypothetical protein
VNAPWSLRRLLAIWLATFFAFAAVAHGNLETTDAAFTMQAARGLWQRGDSGLRTAAQGGEVPGETMGADYIRTTSSGKIGTNDLAYPWFPVGHVWLLVPVVAVGDALAARLPTLDATFRERVAAGAVDGGMTSIIQGRPVVTQGLISLLVPPAAAASLLVLLLVIAARLGAGRRDALIAALSILLATQAFAFGRETLSDGPGLVCLLAALLGVVAVHTRGGTAAGLFAAGLAAGAAVLFRYQNAALLVAIGALLLWDCQRQRRPGSFAAFCLGIAPSAVLLLAVNHARFGDAFDTGYPKYGDWLDQPLWLGAIKILFAPGRGVAWFSPLVWLALPVALLRVERPVLRWLGWLLFLFPLALFALARGWQGGQCWAARYVTHGLVALLVLTLPQTAPWRRWPRLWIGLLLAGFVVNVTGVIAPVRGVLQLGAQAIAARGDVGDPADLTGWQLRYTPLLANWRYAAASRAGGFEDERGHPRNGSAHTIEALFGVAATRPEHGQAPVRWEDRCGRHLWWRFWGDLLGVPGWLLLGPCLLLAASFAALAFRFDRAPGVENRDTT